jgi:hypothetical protein
VEVILREELGDMISEPLMSLPSLEITKEKNKLEFAVKNTRRLFLVLAKHGIRMFNLGLR